MYKHVHTVSIQTCTYGKYIELAPPIKHAGAENFLSTSEPSSQCCSLCQFLYIESTLNLQQAFSGFSEVIRPCTKNALIWID